MRRRITDSIILGVFLVLGGMLGGAVEASAQGAAAGRAPAAAGPSVENFDTLYRVELVRAAPGAFADVMALYESHFDAMEAAGAERPLWMRHSQGDQWDFLVVHPMGSWTAWYAPGPVAARRSAEAAFRKRHNELVSWTEDTFMWGPSTGVLRQRASGAGLFHVEMFEALAGTFDALVAQRHMENAYYAGMDHPGNLIFVRDAGGAWDVMTLGFYRDLPHFAESATWPFDRDDAAARAAGFDGVMAIAPFLRSLLLSHRDTLARAISR